MDLIDRRTLIASAAAFSLAAPAYARRADPRLASDFDAAIARAMALDLSPGLSVAVYTRDGVYTQAAGLADRATGERATPDTAFYVASSTKSLTGLALASLQQKGQLDLETTLAAYAPDAGFPASVKPDQVRLKDLLSHTSGIENNPISYRLAFTGEHDPKTLWGLLAASRPNAKSPLGRFEYANTGYNIATILTDRNLGVRWQDLLRREVFAPAGMTRASALMSEAKARGWSIARPHVIGASGRVEPAYLEKTDQTMQSAGGVVMSGADALRWLEFMVEGGRLDGRQVIAAETVRAICAPVATVGDRFGDYPRDHYGLGWYLGAYRDERMLHDFGGFSGFRTHVSFLPERGVGVAVFANDSTVAFWMVDALANYIYDRTAGRADAASRYDEALRRVDAGRTRLAKQIAERASRPSMLSRPPEAYAGVYENDQWGRIVVTADGRALKARYGVMHATAEPYTMKDSVRIELAPGSGDVVVFQGDGAAPDALLFKVQRFVRSKA
ncbi:MAG: serine hydrolase domain-containing protein [Caulobacteraceae bacterium]